jgi:predicted lipoprotein with Yx(FWY)xxD motif
VTKRLILLWTAAAAAAGLAGCEREPDSNANQVAANVPEATANAGEAPAGMEPVGTASLAVATKEPFGQYLVDAEGRSLYVLEGNRQPEGEAAQPSKQCTGACLGEWPPLTTNGTPQVANGVDASKVATVARDGGQQVTYAGWPLYYYVGDRDPGSTSGQDLHDQWGGWYLLSPAGEPVHVEREGGE